MTHLASTVFVLLLFGISVVHSQRCEGKRRGGWRGKCFGTQDDIIGTIGQCDSLVAVGPGCPDDKPSCCVDCSRLTKLCRKKYAGTVARNAKNFNSTSPCCVIAPGVYELKVGEPRDGSGCSCCKYCRRKDYCRSKKGFCITDEDPVHNRGWCLALPGRVKERGCKGYGCHCCIPNK